MFAFFSPPFLSLFRFRFLPVIHYFSSHHQQLLSLSRSCFPTTLFFFPVLTFLSLLSLFSNPQNLPSSPSLFLSSPLKQNSWSYPSVEVSGHNLESFQTWGFYIQCLHLHTSFEPLARRKTLKTLVPIKSKNSASVLSLELPLPSAYKKIFASIRWLNFL